MSFLGDNIFSPVKKKQNNINSYNTNHYNHFKSIESSATNPSNIPLNNQIDFETPLSSISNNNYLVQNRLHSIYNFQNDGNNLKSKEQYINFLRKKLNNYYQTNIELNNEYKQISKKSKLLINNMKKNNATFSKLQKNYEISLKKNNEIKEKCLLLLEEYKKECMHNNKYENIKQFEVNKLKKEQSLLLSNIKSKENIINILQNTLKVLKNEIEEEKNENLNIEKTKKLKINELKKVLNQLQKKFEENKNYINTMNKRPPKVNNNDNNLLNNALINKSKYNTNNNEIIQEELYKINLTNSEMNNNFEKEENNLNYNIEQSNIKSQINFGIPEISLSNEEKSNYNSDKKEKNIYNYNNQFSNEKNKKLILNQYHKKSQSLVIDDNNNFFTNYIQNINDPIFINYTIPNSKEEKNKNRIIVKKIKNTGDPEKNIENTNPYNPYLFSLTKEGNLIQFDILKKEYTYIDNTKVIEWNNFIKEYLINYEGSLLLNTFQGLFIITGGNYNDLYYFSKKYDSISKLESFNYNHRYGGLILSPDNNALIAIGGTTKNIEILDFENNSIKELPPLLTERINSAFTFIGNVLFAFFGKNNNTIELLDMEKSDKWELVNLKINIGNDNQINLMGHTAIPVNKNEILLLGGIQNNQIMIFNFNNEIIELANINLPFIDKVGEYIFDKDKYFNAYIGNENCEENSLNFLIGMDSKLNIHYFNNNFNYSVILYENKISNLM